MTNVEDEAKRASATVETPIIDSAESIAETVTVPTAPAESSSGISVYVVGQQGKFTKEMIEEGIKDGSIKRKHGVTALSKIKRKEKAAQLASVGAASGTFQGGELVETSPTSPLGMGSQSIPATVETAALSATTTASTLTYVPSRVDANAREAAIGGYRPPNVDTNNISTSTLQQGASSVMHSDAVQLYTQKTMMLQQQGIDANTANAQVTAQMLSQNNTSVVNNNLGTNSLFYPVEAKDHTSSWNGGSSS
jgi:hypothetical protein